MVNSFPKTLSNSTWGFFLLGTYRLSVNLKGWLSCSTPSKLLSRKTPSSNGVKSRASEVVCSESAINHVVACLKSSEGAERNSGAPPEGGASKKGVSPVDPTGETPVRL